MKQTCIYLLTLIYTILAVEAGAEPVTIAAFGDSITRGFPYHSDNANGIPNNGGYIPTLQSQLNAEDWEATVFNFGYPGERVSIGTIPGKHRIAVSDGHPYAVLGSNPDYVLVMEGTNDLALNGIGGITDALHYVIDKIQEDEKIPLIGTLLPRFDEYSWLDVPGLNNNIRQLAVDEEIELADLYYASSNWSSLMTSDGLHPDYSGYEVMAGEWFKALQRTAQEVPPVVTPMLYLLLLTD